MILPVPRPSPGGGGEAVTCHAAEFATQWVSPSAVVISVHGELDAANSPQLVDYALRHAARVKYVVLDLTGVEFFGIAGFSAAHTMNVHCAREQVSWTLVPSAAVLRLLRICDPDSALPVADRVPRPPSDNGDSGGLLELVPEAG
ncbi:STAS domain-containing protein [Mycolicibacterium thermoresistibile]